MSTFIKHIPCEVCGSKDNRGLYSDDHEYCFGCGARKSGSVQSRLKPELNEVLKHITLPYDCTTRLPKIALDWVIQYLTPAEVTRLRLLWSESTKALIFPFYKDSCIIGWNSRNFGGQGPKYQLHGKKNEISQTYGTGDTLVFTEDLLSAVVVSRVTAARPLFGTSLNQEYLTGHQRYVLWLDKDKRIEAMGQSNKFKQFGYSINAVFSEKDPKTYPTTELTNLLGELK
jgi:hypothetical protein